MGRHHELPQSFQCLLVYILCGLLAAITVANFDGRECAQQQQMVVISCFWNLKILSGNGVINCPFS